MLPVLRVFFAEDDYAVDEVGPGDGLIVMTDDGPGKATHGCELGGADVDGVSVG